MKVYTAEQGCYDQKWVVGVFDTPERAIAACHRPGDVWKRSQESNFISWENDKDWDSYVSITETELTTEGPIRSPDSAVVRWDSEDGRRVEYHPVPI